MRVLFASTYATGHFAPLIPFAQACRDAGHDVLVAGPPAVEELAHRAGLAHQPVAVADPQATGPRAPDDVRPGRWSAPITSSTPPSAAIAPPSTCWPMLPSACSPKRRRAQRATSRAPSRASRARSRTRTSGTPWASAATSEGYGQDTLETRNSRRGIWLLVRRSPLYLEAQCPVDATLPLHVDDMSPTASCRCSPIRVVLGLAFGVIAVDVAAVGRYGDGNDGEDDMADAAADVVLKLFDELYNGNDPEAADRLVASNFVNHEAAAERSPGPQGAKETASWLHQAFSDLRFDIEDVISNGEKVVVRAMLCGRHTGAAGPLAQLPVTGRPFRVQHIHIFRVEDGKVAEHWASRDDLGHMGQLGLLPPPPDTGGTSAPS